MGPQLLGELIDRLSGPLGLYARQWCDSPEDVVQEAFLKLAARPEPPDHPAAWLFRSVRNGAINAGIAGRRRRRREAEAALAADAWFEPGIHQEVDPDSAQAALSRLPDDQREVIVAHLWGGLSFGQIAELSGVSSSAAHRLYHAGLAALRSRLEVPCRPTNPKTRPF